MNFREYLKNNIVFLDGHADSQTYQEIYNISKLRSYPDDAKIRDDNSAAMYPSHPPYTFAFNGFDYWGGN